MKLFQLLDQGQIEKMHHATLVILEQIGIATKSAAFRSILIDHGCKLEGDRLTFPSKVVEHYLKQVPPKFYLYGRDQQSRLDLGDKKAYTQTCSGTPSVLDLVTGEHRDYLMQDLVDLTRLADALPDIHLISCGVPGDIDQDAYMVVEIAAMLRNTVKPLRLPIESAAELEHVYEILALVAGGMDRFARNPFLYLEVSPMSPLDFGYDPAEALVSLAQKRVPLGIIPCPMMGATGPMTLIGSVTQHNAEIIAGVVAAQMVSPGAPVIMSPRVTFMDMKTGTGLWAAPETGIAAACSAHLANYYNIPVSVSGFSVAAQVPDQQSGYERSYNALLTALAGVDVLGAAGSLDNALTSCYVQLVLDDEISSMVRRTFRDLAVSEEILAVDVIAEVIKSGSSFLGHKHTRKFLRAGELWNPPVGNRSAYEQWAKTKETVAQKARIKAGEILNSQRQPLLDHDVDAEIEKIIKRAKITSERKMLNSR